MPAWMSIGLFAIAHDNTNAVPTTRENVDLSVAVNVRRGRMRGASLVSGFR